jgi:hypothetical protein
MRVFCPEHKRGFFAPRQSPIKCENRGHMLGELDFEGEAKPLTEVSWQYCCNCEHFCPTGFGQDPLERCPVCSRQSSALYLCDRCFTISFESITSILTKNFTLTSEGAPQPSCPGCLQAASADLREHTCGELGKILHTALSSCPICQERLDIGPSFPSTVAYYLKRTKAAKKLNVAFNYESELFVPVEDGEFVVIRNGNETIQPILLPRSARFTASRDFYELYQDYYHCAKPGAGEVQIIEPAAVTRVADGWKLEVPGILEVLEDQPKKIARADVTPHQPDQLAREATGLSVGLIEEGSPVAPCNHCGSSVETRYAFCWKCGSPLTAKHEPSVTPWERPTPVIDSDAIATEEEEQTAKHQLVPDSSPIFSWALANEPEGASKPNGPLLKLIAAALVGIVIVSAGLFMLMRSTSRVISSEASQAVVQNQPAGADLGPDQVDRKVAIEATPQPSSAARPEDDELKKLRERRIAAGASDRFAILQAFATIERQYPNDYRFPYERAKLVIKASETNSHDEAFAALSLAAEKAINTGKAHEMLNGLEADKAGDFHKLSHGHYEWTQVEEALKSKDRRLLSAKAQF